MEVRARNDTTVVTRILKVDEGIPEGKLYVQVEVDMVNTK